MSNEWFRRLKTRKLLVKTRGRGLHQGTRSSKALGASFDFSDYRMYQPGDDVRQIDWNVFGRTEKLYIKRFLDEQEIHVAIFLDCSTSMQTYEQKWQLAKLLAASLSFIALTNNDRLTFIPIGLDLEVPLKRKGSLYAKQLFFHIKELANESNGQPFTNAMQNRLVKNSQLMIIITDGLENIQAFDHLFKRIAPLCKQVRILQILASEEITPTFTNDVKLVDSENHSVVNVSVTQPLIQQYEKRLQKHNENLAYLCRKYGFSYLFLSDERDPQTFLFQDCVKSGWLE